MNIQEFVENMKKIEVKLLNFLDENHHDEENYELFFNILQEQNILTNHHDLRIILYMISKIANNHHRSTNFYDKIDQILQGLKTTMKEFYSNEELIKIFKANKRILLFLIEEKIITVNEHFYKTIMTDKFKRMKYPEYFSPEIKPFLDSDLKNKENQKQHQYHEEEEEEYSFDNEEESNDDNISERINEISKIDYRKFNEQRKKGEHEGNIERIIQEDSIEEFIIYVNKQDYSLESSIESSIFDTNKILFKETRLIEYAAFFGSTQIFKYLYKNGVELTSALWLYAIHSDHPEMIYLLEENKVEPPDNSYEKCIKESIKCYHNDITNYIKLNLINYDIENIDNINFEEKYNENIYSYSFHYYNFLYFPSEIKNEIFFFYACQYDYFKIVEYFLKTIKINVKDKIILNIFNI